MLISPHSCSLFIKRDYTNVALHLAPPERRFKKSLLALWSNVMEPFSSWGGHLSLSVITTFLIDRETSKWRCIRAFSSSALQTYQVAMYRLQPSLLEYKALLSLAFIVPRWAFMMEGEAFLLEIALISTALFLAPPGGIGLRIASGLTTLMCLLFASLS